jgi:hypothetical protein
MALEVRLSSLHSVCKPVAELGSCLTARMSMVLCSLYDAYLCVDESVLDSCMDSWHGVLFTDSTQSCCDELCTVADCIMFVCSSLAINDGNEAMCAEQRSNTYSCPVTGWFLFTGWLCLVF